MKVRDLLAGAELRGLTGSPEMDPLTEEDALQEARLNEVVFDAVNMRAGLLFDLRSALRLRTAYTGILVLYGVQDFSWHSDRRPTARTAWNVVGSAPFNENGVVNLNLFFFPYAEMTVVAGARLFTRAICLACLVLRRTSPAVTKRWRPDGVDGLAVRADTGDRHRAVAAVLVTYSAAAGQDAKAALGRAKLGDYCPRNGEA